jgi:hypothetical protein
MEPGAFSISLAVVSRAFYEKHGFKVFAGEASSNWLILKNGDAVIGLFQGMFERNCWVLRDRPTRGHQRNQCNLWSRTVHPVRVAYFAP